MGKKNGFKTIAGLAGAAAAAVAVKYLKDYTGFKKNAETDLKNLGENAGEVRTAAKRTYVALKEKKPVKEAVSDLLNAAGETAVSAGNVILKAGTSTAETFREYKEKYDDNPEALKEEVTGNFAEMGRDITRKVSDLAETAGRKFTEYFNGEDVENIVSEAEEDIRKDMDDFRQNRCCGRPENETPDEEMIFAECNAEKPMQENAEYAEGETGAVIREDSLS